MKKLFKNQKSRKAFFIFHLDLSLSACGLEEDLSAIYYTLYRGILESIYEEVEILVIMGDEMYLSTDLSDLLQKERTPLTDINKVAILLDTLVTVKSETMGDLYVGHLSDDIGNPNHIETSLGSFDKVIKRATRFNVVVLTYMKDVSRWDISKQKSFTAVGVKKDFGEVLDVMVQIFSHGIVANYLTTGDVRKNFYREEL